MPEQLLIILPIVLPFLGMAVVLLLPDTIRRWWAAAVSLVSLLVSAWLLSAVWQGGEAFAIQAGGWAAPYGITFTADLLSATLVCLSQLVMLLGQIYALQCRESVTSYPTFFALYLALNSGLTGVYLTGDLFTFFVFAELVVISGSILVASSDHRFGPEAAYKYFYMSLLAATFLLLANGTLYAAYGTVNMALLAERVQLDPANSLLPAGIALLFAAFMIKGAVFPMHLWQPDVYNAAPAPVSAVLSSVVVKMGFYGFLRMTTLMFVGQAETIRLLLLIFGLTGMLYGGLAAIGTADLKRMLAYSTLAQIGFMLVGIGWGTQLSIAAALVFAVNHALIKAAMLMLAGALSSRTPQHSSAFRVITGAGRQIPAMGFLFFVGALALSGIPPTNGFVSKWLLFSSGARAEEHLSLLLLALGSMATLIYSTRAFQRIWFKEPQEGAASGVPGDRLLAPALLIGTVLLLGIWAEPLVRLAADTSAWLGDPAAYIQAVLGG